MRRTVLLLAVMALATVAASGIALADNIQGNGANNRLVGTNGKDTIAGSGNNDSIFGRGGGDRLYGDSGNDLLRGGAGNDDVFGGKGDDEMFGNGGSDYINAADKRENELVDCGPGEDEAVVDGTTLDFIFLIAVPTDDVVNCEELYVAVSAFGGLLALSQDEVPQAVEEGGLEKTK